MKEVTVDISKTYALRSETGGEVMDANSKPLETLEANKQKHMTAQESVWLVPDDCKVTKTNFKSPLLALRLLGQGENVLPSGYTRVKYLESTGTQYINTGYFANSETTTKTRWAFIEDLGNYSFIFEPDSGIPRYGMLRNINGTIRCDYGEAMNSANKVLDIGRVYDIEKRGRFNYIDGELVVTNPETEPFEQSQPMYISSGKSMYRAVFRLYSFIMENNNKALNLIPALDQTGTPCLYDLVSKQTFYNRGSGDFLYPGKEATATTYSLRRPRLYAQMTEHGIRRLYHVPKGYNGTPEEYAAENGFKVLVETEQPEEGYCAPVWHEREDCIELEWVETEPPTEQEL